MKKITFTIALITLAAMASFAAGTSEEETIPWTQGQGQYQSDAVLSEVATTVTGTINLVEGGHVELVTDSGTYELVYPYRLSSAADLQNGMVITVEGFEAENLRLDNDAATINLVLRSATIDGETYNLADVSNDFGRNSQKVSQQGGNRVTSNNFPKGNQQKASIGQRGRNTNSQGGLTQIGSFGKGRR